MSDIKEVPLPALPDGFTWVLPEAAVVRISHIVLRATNSKREMSIYFDTECEAGVVYEEMNPGDIGPLVPVPYVECYDRDDIFNECEAFRFVIPRDIDDFNRHIAEWCAARSQTNSKE